MNLRGAIFDVDGTLLDSMSVWDTVGEDYLRSFGIEPKRNFQETVKAMSLYQAARHMQKAYELSLSTAEITAGINGRIEDFYRHDAPLKPGASELLAQLSRRSVKMCLATATDRHLIEAALSRLGVLSYFTEIFTCASVGHGKDEPHIFEAALRCLGTEKAETVVFEDALHAVRTAKAAGFPVAAVCDPHEDGQEALRKLADYYLTDLSQFHTVCALDG